MQSAISGHDRLQEIKDFFDNTVSSKAFSDSIRKASELLFRKKAVIFAGLGSSDITSGYGAGYFSNLFGLSYRVENIQDYPVIKIPKEFAGDTCVLALSVTGETAEVITYIRNFSNANYSIIAITGNPHSKLASMADITIAYTIPFSFCGINNMSTQIPALYIIEKLGREVAKLQTNNSQPDL
ncbi:MAG: MurR/RpiR family transcriptional regulator [Atopobium sp.]|nr:MurR/RpiR family transcriptional regulator [Atopobium sp.]